ncbi:phosphatidylglycerophosphatase A family protein [Dokdonella immobilis]|uniref:Phosphatidylglycerophosphatase A n=1 Tax=Dokdonella immobilis TaxID=578942 RepID=A0A1I4YPT3_9GAMM|nr:phosphatidylglycerophosphatase A [Dokdonella immobilis]SFN39977.1 phosphatidylglycerophosphatase [Dokdonella immobilis]
MKLDREQRRAVLGHPAGWIASGFGSGLSRYAPGTAGSAAALIPWLGLRELPIVAVVAIIAVAFAIGVWASNVVIGRLRISDPGVIVCDEFVGQWITLLPLLIWPVHWVWLLVGFFLFRLFDVWKPWPCSWADRHVKGGFGVMLDDALAGIYAAMALALVTRI